MTIMNFHRSVQATRMCVCDVRGGRGYDAFNTEYRVITDDFGNIVFVL